MKEPKLIQPGVIKELNKAQRKKMKKKMIRHGSYFGKGGGSKEYKKKLKEAYEP